MRILVTGARGFAGTHLLDELVRSGPHEITACTYGEPGLPDESRGESVIRWAELDVKSAASVRDVVRNSRPEFVYHLAGQASVGESFRAPLQTWDVNATGTVTLLEALREEAHGATRMLLTSSAEVYGAASTGGKRITEESPVRPLTPYGASKAAAEVVAAQYSRAGMVEVVIARSFNQIGPGQDERFVLPSFARQLARMRASGGRGVLRVGNLDVFRDFLDVRDGVRAYVHMMDRGEPGAVYNVASGVARSLEEVVRRLVHFSDVDADLVVDADRVRPVDIPELIGDPARLNALGWEPRYELDVTLRDLLRSVREVHADG